MATVKDHIDVQVQLNTAVAPEASFGTGLFLVDDTQIPADKRWIVVTPDDYDNLDSSSHAYKYAAAYFGQKRIPDTLIIGRLFEAASLAYWYSGADADLTIATWAAITTGSCKVGDGTGTEDFTGFDFTGVTTIAQILAVIQAKLDLAATVTGITVIQDTFDRIQFVGAAAQTITVIDAASGTSLSTLLDYAGSASVATVAIETAAESVQAIEAQGVGFYNINLRSSFTTAELVTFAQWVETQNYLVDFVYTTVDAIGSAATTDLGYKLKALGLDRSMVIYTEKTLEYPDAADAGCVLPGKEGSISFAWEALKSVTDSGSPDPLSSTSRAVLKTKGYSWIETIESNNILYPGITAGNEEKRVMLGRDWYTFTIQSRIFVRQINVELNAFDNETMGALEKIIREVSEEAVERRIILDTPAYPLTITLPDADDIPQEQRDAHEFEELEAFEAKINSAINDYKIVGIWNS